MRQRTPQLYGRLERRTSTGLSCQLSSPRAATATVAEQRDELAAFQMTELHSISRQPDAGYRIGSGQSAAAAMILYLSAVGDRAGVP